MKNLLLRSVSTVARRHYGMQKIARQLVSRDPAAPTKILSVVQKNNPAFIRSYSSEVTWPDDKFNEIVNNNKLVVFMKGTPDEPMCGFSKYVIQILHMHGCENFTTLNVLDDDVLRNRVKEFSNWPTIPQVYMGGEFLGGFDILLQMHQEGELIDELDKIGHRSLLIDADKEE